MSDNKKIIVDESLILEAINRLSICITMIDSNGKLLFSNNSAKNHLGNNSGHQISCQWTPNIQNKYAGPKELYGAIATKLKSGNIGSTSALVRINDNEASHFSATRIGDSDDANILIVVNRLSDFEKTSSHVGNIFGLTSSETKIMQSFGRLHDVSLVANEMKIEENTVRAHLKSIYAKLNTHKQSDLTSLLAGHPSSMLNSA